MFVCGEREATDCSVAVRDIHKMIPASSTRGAQGIHSQGAKRSEVSLAAVGALRTASERALHSLVAVRVSVLEEQVGLGHCAAVCQQC